MGRLTRLSLTVAACLIATGPAAMAQSFPQKEITIVIGAPPGGANDIVARLVADNLKIGDPAVPVVVLHKPGAGGQIASDHAAGAAPDGYTLFLGTTAITVGPFVQKSFTPLDSYTPIINLVELSTLMNVDARLPINNIAEFKAYALANPGKVALGSSGGQLDMVPSLLSEALGDGVQLKHVPFSGVAPVFAALLAGDIQVVFASPAASRPFVEANQIRTIAVGTAKRDPLMPDVPTVAEGGAPGFEIRPAWFGILGPKGMPPALVEQLNTAFNAVLSDPAIVKRFNDLNMNVIGGTPEDLVEVMKNDVIAYEKGAKLAGIEPK